MSQIECGICGWLGNQFTEKRCDQGNLLKEICPRCSSAPRHRSFHLFLKNFIPDVVTIKLLHFAPELCLENFLRSYSNIDYLSVDIDQKKAMTEEDITQLSFPDESFDLILCFHVLEHVIDDAQAIRELHRVLKKESYAIIDVPVHYGMVSTYEDVTIIEPEERAKAFWNTDHVRIYGKDFPNRLRENGFKVTEEYYIKSLGEGAIKRHVLMETPIYLCSK